MKDTRNRVMKILRPIWILMAVGFMTHLVTTHWNSVIALRQSLLPWQPITCFLLIIAGKLLYTEVVRSILVTVNAKIRFGDAFYAHNVSQLGKYIPGSVWQFLALYEIYKRYGVTSLQAFRMLLLENSLQLATALILGLGTIPIFEALILNFISWPILALIGTAGLGILAILIFMENVRARVLPLVRNLWAHRILALRVSLLFLGMWILIGLSASALFASYKNVSPLFVITLFAISFVVGFAAPFAPAGIGVRDVIFVIGLTGFVEPEVAALLAIGHRILYILADILCGASAWVAFKRPFRSAY